MPIYECNCEDCGITFEILAPVSEANRQRPCPRCVRPARRVVSAFAIGSARALTDRDAINSTTASSADAKQSHAGHAHHANAQPGRRNRPTVPDFARLCWMDDRSAERFAAYKLGRGAEYDDKSAAREDLRKKRGLPPTPGPDTSNSPVAAMVAREKAEQAKKAAKAVKNGAAATATTFNPAPSGRRAGG
jgi:putative FmdB family regulatory protein